MIDYTHFENLSYTAEIGVIAKDIVGQTLYESGVHKEVSPFLNLLYALTDCEDSCQIAFLYGSYQARRFGGRYIFYAPSGLAYCASALLDEKGTLQSGVLLGPFILTDYEDFLHFDVQDRFGLSKQNISALYDAVGCIPCITPKRAQALSEHLHYMTTTLSIKSEITETVPKQTDFLAMAYPLEKEEELLAAISKGDIHVAERTLKEILKQTLLHCGGNVEILRSRSVELIVLLSRAALKGGADSQKILELNYEYMREIDELVTIEDIALWLAIVTRSFTNHVFQFSSTKHTDIIHKAVDYIRRNYASKLSLQEMAGYLFISRQYLCRIFKESTGQTVGGYITYVRIEESKKLLRDSQVDIIDIPERVGFENQSYFTKIFKKETGTTPGRYRRERL